MIHPRDAGLTALLILATATVAAAATPTAQAEESIAETNRRLSAAYAAGDAEAAAACYTEDAWFMVPNGPTLVGTEAIRAAAQAEMDNGIRSLELTTDELEVHGDTASEVGRYVLANADGTEVDRGKYIVLWRNTEDGWKLHRDIFNSDLPAPQPD